MGRAIMKAICMTLAIYDLIKSLEERNKANPDIFAYLEWKFCALMMLIALWGL